MLPLQLESSIMTAVLAIASWKQWGGVGVGLGPRPGLELSTEQRRDSVAHGQGWGSGVRARVYVIVLLVCVCLCLGERICSTLGERTLQGAYDFNKQLHILRIASTTYR